jgi:O-antigen ligase
MNRTGERKGLRPLDFLPLATLDGDWGRRLHTLLFVAFGLGVTLSYGLGTSSFTLPKWLFLVVGAAAAMFFAALRLRSGLRSRRGIAFDATDAALAAFCGYAGLSLLWARDPGAALLELAGYLALAAIFLYARRTDGDRLAFRIALVSLLAIFALLVRGVLLPKAIGGFGNVNHFAGTLLVAVPFALLWFRLRAGPDRWAGPLLAAAALVWLAAVNGSGMEYAVIAALAAAAALLWTSRRFGRPAAVALAAAAAIAGIVVLWLAWDRLVEIYPFRHRVEFFVNTLALWRERPMFGHGLGGFDYAFPRFQQYHLTLFPPERYPAFGVLSLYHAFRLADAAQNEALQLLVETGVAGVLLAGLVLIAPLRAALADHDRSPLFLAAALALGALVTLALLGSPLRAPSTAAFGALALGILSRRRDDAPAPFRIPLGPATATATTFAGALALAGTLYASAHVYRAGIDHGLAQALRARSSWLSLVLESRAHDRVPQSPQYRRQLYLNYVDWFQQTRERGNPKAPDEQALFRSAMSAGPYVPGLLLVRIRYLLIRRPGLYEREEIELRLSALKAWVPYLVEVHAAEAAYARSIGNYARADAALREAVRVKKLREYESGR